ncbi:CU044_5270 family protein [Streptomyces sp. NPDC052052]|uniref:CU044_5270 family protein n=1 Tax=Streptomyces sp. NPDC052052 TaxID=3154756 RepID=UPI00342ED853
MLKKLYELPHPIEGQEADQAVFDRIGELLHETVMPAENAAAFYKAAAHIPGVTLLDDVTDPAGRHGVAVVRVDKHASTATQWIFDRKTLAFLGDRSYLTKDVTEVKKGTVMSETAVLRRAVVDGYRERPSGS